MTTNLSRAQRWVVALTAIASFVVVLDLLVVATALGAIRADLHASLAELEWTINAYTLAFAVLLMTASAIGDRLGRRRTFALGLALFGGASAGCALSPSIGWLIAWRAIQGAGAATIMPLALAQLNSAVPPALRGRALGIYGAITGLGALLGPIIGGAVTEGLAWPWVFWVNVPVCAIAIPMVIARLDETHGPRVAIDVPGLVLLTASAFGLVWALVRANEVGWGSFEIVASLGGGLVAAVGFVEVQRRAAAPLLPLRLFGSRAFSAGNLVVFCLSAAITGGVFFMAQFEQVAGGLGPLDAGLRLLPWGIAPFVVAPRAGALADRIGERPLIVIGLVLNTIGMAWIALVASPGVPYLALVGPMTIVGIGFALVFPAVTKTVISGVARDDIGKASGAFSTLRQLGNSFGVAIPVAVFARVGDYSSPDAFARGFSAAIAVTAVLSAIGLAAAIMLPAPSDALARAS